ncbi:CapA family protein [Streptomyces telluris]|uniref:CapA family protein n=1 Tax=Streptomyces telluris TaxID=2720021 RepID=UPI00143C675E|nr:CapA family protein [Streptomyces telluris]
MKDTTKRAASRRCAVTAGVVAALAGVTGCPGPGHPADPVRERATEEGGTHTRPGTGVRTAPPGPARTGFTLVASGDVLPHDEIIRQAQQDGARSGRPGGRGKGARKEPDFGPMFAGVKGTVSAADLAICHMETVYGRREGPFRGYPSFVSPPQVARALKETGYDACSTASNHTTDAGSAGVARTLAAMDEAGLRHAGSARSEAEARQVTLLRAGPARVAHLSYTYATNAPVPEGRPWMVNLTDPARILSDARAARAAGADVVVVSMHWGTEWQSEPDGEQLSLARQLTRAGGTRRPAVDLILGTHNHVPQAYEKVNGTWVVYGMGDQLAGRMINPQGEPDRRGNESTIARFTFAPPAREGSRWRVVKAEFLPQITDHGPPWRVLELPPSLRARPGGRADLERARQEITEVVLSRGAAGDGLTPAR